MHKFSVTILLSSFVIAASTCAAAEFEELFEHIPRTTNAILAIDVDRTLMSKVAVDNDWKKRFGKSYEDRPIYLPPESDKVVVAGQVDPVRGFSRAQTVALISMKEPLSMNLLARAEGGYTDEINGVSVAWVPSDAYFIEVDKQLLGMQAPANRQAISRWARLKKQGAGKELSPYLETAAQLGKTGPQIVMALDAIDTVQPHRLEDHLQQSELLKDSKASVDQLVAFFLGMRGVTLKLTLNNKIQAVGQVDFSQSVPFNADMAKEIILHVLDDNEMDLPGIEDWNYEIKDHSIVFSGDLTIDNMRRLLSLMDIPSTKFSSLKDQNVEESSSDDVAQNSLAYFKSVTALLEDLRPKQKKANASDARWMESYAAKIDKLPILHVDKDLLDYGENLSQTLRVMAGTRRTTGMQGGINARHVNDGDGYDNGYGYNYGYRAYRYSRVGINETINEQNTAKADARAAGTATKIQGWTLIDNATVDIRRQMTERYNLEF